MRLIVFVYMLCTSLAALAQNDKKYVYQGNALYQQKKFAEAEASYRKSVEQSKASLQGNFNLGDALFKQKKFDDAAQKFTEIAGSSQDKGIKAGAYHNLGNALLESKKLKESIEAYKKSLINNPKDDQTRYNLAYAQELLKKQQQNKDKNDKNQDNKDKKDQDKKNQDKKNQDKKDNKDQDKDKKDNKDQNKDQQDKDKQDQNKKDQQQGQQPQPDKLSKEDAERMLEALKNEEKNTQDKLKNKKAKGGKARIVKDW